MVHRGQLGAGNSMSLSRFQSWYYRKAHLAYLTPVVENLDFRTLVDEDDCANQADYRTTFESSKKCWQQLTIALRAFTSCNFVLWDGMLVVFMNAFTVFCKAKCWCNGGMALAGPSAFEILTLSKRGEWKVFCLTHFKFFSGHSFKW